MKKWFFSITFVMLTMQQAHAQTSWLDSAKSAAAKTWESAQRTFIYDDRPVQSFADPLLQQINQRVNEENQRFHGAHEASIQRRQEGYSCDALKISDSLEENFINSCTIPQIQDSCLAAVKKAQSFSSNETLINPAVQDRVTLQQLKTVHKRMIKNLNSIVQARESCYEFLSKPLVDGQSLDCKQSLETTLNELADQVAALCTEEDFNNQIDAFVDKMRDPKGPAGQILVAKQQYTQVRKTEIQIARVLLSLTETIQARLTRERATASSETQLRQKGE